MPKKILSLCIAAALSLTMLCGCAGDAKSDLPAPEPDTTSAPAMTSDTPTETVPEDTEAPEVTEPDTEINEEETEEMTETITTSETTTPATEPVTEPSTEPVTEPAPETFAVDEANGIMYANNDVNVRSGPDASYERVGHLNRGDGVEITGLTESGWYRIKFKGGEYFVSGKYLSAEKPAETTVTTAATTVSTTAATTVTTVTTLPTTVATSAVTSATVKKTEERADDIWITTWSTAVMPPDGDDKIPSNPKLANNTVRQQVRVSTGGYKIRLVLSNEQGSTELKIEKLTVALLKSPSKPDVDLDTLATVTYGGKTSFSIPAGKRITTDELDFEFSALADIAITMKLGSVPSTLTCHTASRCYTWTTAGNHVSDNNFDKFDRKTSWYFIAGLETMAPKGSATIVTLGDSLTDGASISDNSFARYSDELARQLAKHDDLNNYGVAAMGIGGTSLYTFGAPIDGSKRVQRDVLDVTGAKYLILMMGTNDIGYSWNDVSDGLIREYKNIIKKCHDKGIKVIGMTIPPNKGSGHYSESKEKMRKKANDFILSKDSGFDLVIDISSVMASANDPEKMDQKYLSPWGDWLHFNETGYKTIGKTVYNEIKDFIAKEN